MGETQRPLRPRPTREAGENHCGWALRLLAWYDSAAARGYALAELQPLSEDERTAILASWAPVLCIAYNLGLIPLPTRSPKPASPAKESVNPPGTEAPSNGEGSPATSSEECRPPRRGGRRVKKGGPA